MTFPDRSLPMVDPLFRSQPFASGRFIPPTDLETQEFLEDTTDLDDTFLMWNNLSGLSGLLQAVINSERVRQQARKLAEVYFDFVAGRYRYIRSGRLVPINQVRMGTLRVAKAQEIYMRDLTRQLANGEITERQWYNSMRKAMKDQYRSSWIASIGGEANYTRSEASKFGWAVRPQYRWLDNFMLEIRSGKQPMNSFAIRRAGMYARAGNVIYQNNLLKVAEQNGKREAKRELGPTENHCHDTLRRPGCIELAAKGWVPIGQAVELGAASCFSHCLCSWSFR